MITLSKEFDSRRYETIYHIYKNSLYHGAVKWRDGEYQLYEFDGPLTFTVNDLTELASLIQGLNAEVTE